jgi:hypothetical protein
MKRLYDINQIVIGMRKASMEPEITRRLYLWLTSPTSTPRDLKAYCRSWINHESTVLLF